MLRSVVIVQARLGSSRLPGKVLEHLAGRSVLSHVLERCRAIPGADDVCCAVPAGQSNDMVAHEAQLANARITRGPEMDVLARYYKAAIECDAEVVVRITSDCPLIDPDVVGKVLAFVANSGADYACNNQPRSWPHGLDCEAFSSGWLARAVREAKLPEEREHVTPFLRSHPDVRRMNLEGPGGDIAGHRWTLDTPQDLRFLQALYERLPPGPAAFNYRVPLTIVERDPNLKALMG